MRVSLCALLLIVGCATPSVVGPVTGRVYDWLDPVLRREERLAHYKRQNLQISPEEQQRLLAGQIWIGMSSDLARISMGNPDDVNRTVYSFGVHEQWVYECWKSSVKLPCTFLYFENGKLTSWQD